MFPAVDPRALALGDTDVDLDPLEVEDGVGSGKDTGLEGVTVIRGVEETELVVTPDAVDEMGNGAVVIGGTGVTLEVSDSVLDPESELVAVPPMMVNAGLMFPELPKTAG